MSKLIDMAKAVLGGTSGTTAVAEPDLMSGITLLLGGSGPGGITNLVQAFKDKGLGEIVSSWVSTGANLPVSADQVHNVLGAERVHDFATKAGIAPETASSTLASLLPNVIDKLTPDGKIPEEGLANQLLGLFKSGKG